MFHVTTPTKKCSCGDVVRLEGQRYCRGCHNVYMREHRLKHSELSSEQKKRANARSYANCYKRRGILTPEPCEACDSIDDIEMHHDDYDKPLVVRWLCKSCHDELHIMKIAC